MCLHTFLGSQRSEQSDLVNVTLSSFFPRSRRARLWVRKHRALQARFFIWLDRAANKDKIGQLESLCETRCDQRKAQISHKGLAVRSILHTWSPLGTVAGCCFWGAGGPLLTGSFGHGAEQCPRAAGSRTARHSRSPSLHSLCQTGLWVSQVTCHGAAAAAWGTRQCGGFQLMHKQKGQPGCGGGGNGN